MAEGCAIFTVLAIFLAAVVGFIGLLLWNDAIMIGGFSVAGVAFVLLVVVALAGFGIGAFADSMKPDSGPILSKSHRDAYTTTTMIMVGKVMVPQTHHHPESWELTIGEAGWQKTVGVSQADFDRYRVGEQYL